ncbi:MAG: RDD family protein [Pseudomonas sp.]|uniref:RDD family protein n=1 Tax=Pseudomonas sp. TaxID=306 RepID=UPI0033950973
MVKAEEKLMQTFRLLSTESLLERQSSGGLTEVAETALEKILAERNLSPTVREKITAAVQEEKRAQTFLAALVVRALAKIIDLAIAVAFIALGSLGGLPLSKYAVIPILSGMLVAMFYMLFCDGLARGQSVGKRLMRIAVIDESTHKPCSYTQSLVRNLLLGVLGVIDLIAIVGKKRQRLGDNAAKTIVVNIGYMQGRGN